MRELRREWLLEAHNIPERSLIAAADVLGVRTRKGQWWLPQSAHTI